jgi:hypothetical protein
LKKLTAILFLGVLAFSHLGYYSIYRFQQQQWKEAMETKLLSIVSENVLEIIELEKNSADISWGKEYTEFTLHGELYDVAKLKKVNGKTFLYCLNDKKEKQLMLDYSKELKSTTDTGKSGKSSVNYQVTDLISSVPEKATFVAFALNKKSLDFIVALSSSDKTIHTPPPKA